LVLQGLYAHPTLLEFDFRIQREDTVDYVNVLSGLIRSTTVLKKLSLNGLYLDADGTETIVDALSANESIAKLSLLYCTFAIERGGQLLRKYLSSQPRLRELCVRGDTRRLEDAGIYANTARLLDTQSIDIESVNAR
jgi:hypothetical protein